jgi:hypothetical protein
MESNRYLLPSVILLCVVCIFAFAVFKSHKSLTLATASLDQNKEKAVAIENSLKIKSLTLDSMKKASSPANTFIAAWNSALGAERDETAMLTDLTRLGTESTISVQNRKSGISDYSWRGKPQRVRFAEATGVSSEYYRLMNWLGEMERAWPLSRFEQIALEQKGQSLQLALKISYPTFLTDGKSLSSP